MICFADIGEERVTGSGDGRCQNAVGPRYVAPVVTYGVLNREAGREELLVAFGVLTAWPRSFETIQRRSLPCVELKHGSTLMNFPPATSAFACCGCEQGNTLVIQAMK